MKTSRELCPSKALIEFPCQALQESCTIAAPDMAVVVDQPSLQTSRVFAFDSCVILVWHLLGSTSVIMLPSILAYGGTCLPNSMCSNELAHAAVPYQAFHYSVIYLPRWCSEEALWRNRLEAFRYSITCLSRWPSREALERNCLDTTKLTTCQPNGWVAWTASSCHLSRVSHRKYPSRPLP